MKLCPAGTARVVAGSLLAILWSHPAPALDPEKPFHQFHIAAWAPEDGLPQGSVVSILQSNDGYLWLGGYEGLNRFDGVRFTVFDAASTPGLENNNVFALAQGADGSLWLGTDGGGLTRFKDGGWTTYTTRDGLAHDRVTALAPARDGSLWVGTFAGLTRFDDDRLVTYSDREGLPPDTVWALTEDRQGSLWIGTDSALARFQDGTFSTYTVEHGLADDGISALHEDRDGVLWVGTFAGTLSRFENGAFHHYTTRDGLPGKEVTAIHEDRDGTLWIGTNGAGLARLHAGKVTAHGVADGLTSDAVWSVFEDREGGLWAGTEGGGLLYLKDPPLVTHTRRDGLPHDRIWTVYEDSEGALWVGTDGGGLARFADDGVTTYTTRDGLAGDAVTALCQQRDGSLWIGTKQGLDQMRDGRIATGLVDESWILALHEDRRGDLWIGTDNGELLRIRDATVTTEGSFDDPVGPLLEDRNGTLWIGTDSGLVKLEDGKTTPLEDLDGAFVRAIHEDPEGDLWIGTRGRGLIRIRNDELTTYTTRDGLASDVIYQILEDDRQRLWMSCNKGIFRVAKKDLDDFARGTISSIRSVVYGTADGMKSLECNGGTQPAGWKTRDGKLWFPTVKGLVAVDPENLNSNELPPPVHVERVVFDGIDVATDGDKTVLPPGRRELEFHYTALSLLDPKKVRFKYQLVGYDEIWVDAGTRRSAYYTNLSPGDYRFRVIASNNDGVWNETGDGVELYLRPAFYQTRTFYLSCLLGAVLLGRGLHRLRVRGLLRHNEELRQVKLQLEAKNAEVEAKSAEMERFTYTVSHDLKSPLLTVQGFLGYLEKDVADGDAARAEQDIRQIRTASMKMRQLLDELSELSRIGRVANKPRQMESGQLAREAVDLVAGRIAERGVEVTVSPDLPAVFGDRARFLQVFQNLIENAVKFMGPQSEPHIDIGAGSENGNGYRTLFVRDNGIGIDPKHQDKIFDLFKKLNPNAEGTGMGLALIKRIIETHGGRIWVESAGLGEGSTFFFTMPPPREPGSETGGPIR